MPANTTPQPKLRSDNWTLTPIPVLTPMMFLSGVFFPREQLPPLVRTGDLFVLDVAVAVGA